MAATAPVGGNGLPMIRVETLEPSESEAWDAFLRDCDGGLVYYSSPYRDVLLDELGCEAEYLVARDGDEILGALPTMWSESDGGRVLNSLPFYGSHGAPLAKSPEAERALIDAWEERASDSRTLAATMVANPFRTGDAIEPAHDFTDERIAQVTSLGPDPEQLMSVYSKNGRRDVRRAERRGVTVERDPERLADVARLHGENIRSIGGIPKTEGFFASLARHFEPDEGYDVWIAKLGDEMVAGLLVLYFSGVAEYFTPAVDPEHRADEPMAQVLHHAMTHAGSRGFDQWNWGGTWSSQDGVYRFKRKWGASDGSYRYFVRVNDRAILEATPEQLLERFPHFYVAPFSALSQS
jgi:hypothetical protein